MKGRRLLIFIHDLAPFGAQRMALGLAQRLDKEEFPLTVCSFGADTTLEAALRSAGAEVVVLGASRYLDLRAWGRFFGLLSGLRPAIVQTNLAELSVPVRVAALLMPGTSVVHTVQNPLSSEPWYWRILNRASFMLCRRVIFCSEGIRAEAGCRGGRFAVVQNGIAPLPVPAEPGLRRELGIGASEDVVCCVARLARQKGQDVLLRAFALLAAGRPGLRLLLAGDGEDEAALRAYAAGAGLSEKVFFLGRRADVGEVLAASDIYAAPSRWEGFGISLGEAMLAGLPCVATGIAGHYDLLEDGVTGIAVRPEDPGELAAGIARLLDEPASALALAREAAARVAARFGLDGMADGYRRNYLGVLDGERGI